METTNVGNVDLDELKKAREELDKERGIESDPNMYANYNPNRKTEEDTVNENQSESDSEEAIASNESNVESMSDDSDRIVFDEATIDVDALADSILEDVMANMTDESSNQGVSSVTASEETPSFDDSLKQNEVQNQPQETTEQELSEPDFSMYDNFAEFEVGGTSAGVNTEKQEDVEVIAENAQPEPETEDVSATLENLISEDAVAEKEDAIESKVDDNASENEELSINPATTDGLINFDNFEINSAENKTDTDEMEETSVPSETEINVDADVGNFSSDEEDESSLIMSSMSDLVGNLQDETSENLAETSETENVSDEPVIAEKSDELESDHETAVASEESNITTDMPSQETSAPAEQTQTDDNGLTIATSYKQLEELLGEDEEAQKLIKEMEEVAETSQEPVVDVAEARKSKIKLAEIEPVRFVDVISSESFKNSDKLSYVFGKNENNDIVYGNLRDSYNIAIFGKETTELNNLIHSVLLSLIMKNSVNDINFIICDSKADSKFEIYNKSSYMYFNRIAKTNKEILDTLIELSKELEERYNLLATTGVKSIEQYNIIAKNDNLKPLPYLLTVFNNYSKSIQLTNSDKINACLHQILKFGRIVGLYLVIVANTTIISDEINYNLPTRLAFKTDDVNRSLTTLGFAGSEALQSSDDILLSTVENEGILHLKVASLTKPELELLIENIEE